MTERLCEVCCEPLSGDVLDREVKYAIRYLENLGAGEVEVMYGVMYDNVPNQYEWFTVADTNLREFFRASEKDGIYGHGDGDLSMRVQSCGIEVRLCHESDVHVSSDAPTVEHFSNHWKAQQLRVWLSRDPDEPP